MRVGSPMLCSCLLGLVCVVVTGLPRRVSSASIACTRQRRPSRLGLLLGRLGDGNGGGFAAPRRALSVDARPSAWRQRQPACLLLSCVEAATIVAASPRQAARSPMARGRAPDSADGLNGACSAATAAATVAASPRRAARSPMLLGYLGDGATVATSARHAALLGGARSRAPPVALRRCGSLPLAKRLTSWHVHAPHLPR